MKQKEVEAVFGGKAEFENADSLASMSKTTVPQVALDGRMNVDIFCSTMPRRRLQRRPCILLSVADSECRRADDNIFEGGCCFDGYLACCVVADRLIVYYMRRSLERELNAHRIDNIRAVIAIFTTSSAAKWEKWLAFALDALSTCRLGRSQVRDTPHYGA